MQLAALKLILLIIGGVVAAAVVLWIIVFIGLVCLFFDRSNRYRRMQAK